MPDDAPVSLPPPLPSLTFAFTITTTANITHTTQAGKGYGPNFSYNEVSLAKNEKAAKRMAHALRPVALEIKVRTLLTLTTLYTVDTTMSIPASQEFSPYATHFCRSPW
jgi:hypothetical protein